ncbi:BTAD domain-containing putative transcriptional regulator [Streptomyces sp. NPDC002574]|uniref:BTAD domain-containing putative transcriptional regulator n=1 Tax=Streptomyces sp. NPDC002574 TaxID=3364652 RepID=UPI0036A77F40
MRFGILGETRALRPDGETASAGGPGRRALLAMLLLETGRIVSTERLIDGLYGEEPPAGVGNALQSQVSRLRSAIGAPVESHPGGYRLAVPRDEVDVHRFERLAAEGREALAAGGTERAAGLLREALGLWRGSALSDVGDAPFAGPQITRLEELRVATLEDRIAADLTLDAHRHGELAAELRELVAAYPLRERLRAQLMRALYSCGRQSEALAVYEDARRELADNLGADPGPELAGTHLAVLRGDPAPVVRTVPVSRASGVSRETSATARPVGSPPPLHALPAPLTSFVGREEELERIGSLLAGARLVTLVGPGGAGKTRLAVEAAGRYGGEACFVDLSGLTHGTAVPQTVAGALGLREAGPLSSAGREAGAPGPLARLTAALTDRDLLLVLDNCEHLIDDVARLTHGLLSACAGLRVLATSREALGITGEALSPLAPLPLPEDGADDAAVLASPAVRLLVDRAAAAGSAESLPDPGAAARICRALDGMPLAIELAAARLRSLSAAEIADRLDALPGAVGAGDRFRLLSRGSRTAQPRQRTLRGVVDWSWELLSEEERTVLRRASVFAGGWTLAAAEAVCAGPAEGVPGAPGIDADDVLDLLASLADKSLVVVRRPEGGAARGTRYRLLQTIRAYAADRAAEAGETERLRRAHAACFLDLALTADPHLRRAEQLDWLDRLAADHDNLHSALRGAVGAGDTAVALRLLAALCTYWMLRGMRYEGAQPAVELLRATGTGPPQGLDEEYALCVMTAAAGTADQSELAEHFASVGEVVRRLGGLPRRFPVLNLLWAPFSGVPDTETYAVYQRELAAMAEEPWQTALMHIGSGFQRWMVEGDIEAAEVEFTAALTAFRTLGDRWGATMALTQLAWLSGARGDLPRAARLVDEALTVAREIGATENVAELLGERGKSAVRAGRADRARADFTACLELARRSGAREMLAGAHLGLGQCARLEGDLAEARRLCELALSECLTGWYTGEGARAETLIALGRIALAEGRPEQARVCFLEAADPAHGARNLPLAAALAEARADLSLAEGDPAAAAELLGVARALRGPSVPALPESDRTDAAVRTALGAAGYETAYARGAGLSADRALRALTRSSAGA